VYKRQVIQLKYTLQTNIDGERVQATDYTTKFHENLTFARNDRKNGA